MARPVGYKIRHRSLRNCVAAVEVGWRELPANPQYGVGGRCPTCMKVHVVKTYHLNVDSDGGCVVSPKVFDNLCRAGAIDGTPQDRIMVPNGQRRWRSLQAPPFEYVDTIEPVPLHIGMGGKAGTVIADAEGRTLYRDGLRIINLHDDYTET